MKEIFSLSRFFNYAKLHYWGKWGAYATLFLVTFVAIIFLSCNMEPFIKKTVTGDINHVNYIRGHFMSTFFCVGAIFSYLFVEFSLSSFDNRGEGGNAWGFTMKDLLLPVSTFERYIFTILNSTIVAVLIYILIFSISSSILEQFYYFGENSRAFIGLLNIKPVITGEADILFATKDMHRVNIFKLSEAFNLFTPNNEYKVALYVLIFSAYSTVLSVLMWGKITFRRFATIKNVVIHVALWVLLIWIFTEFIPNLRPAYDSRIYPDNFHDLYTPLIATNGGLNYLSPLLLIPTIVYQWVFWKKLKTLSLSR